MRLTRLSVLLALPLMALFAGACGGGKSIEESLQNVTSDQLALMVLTADEIGSVVDGLEIDPDSGRLDAEEEADGTLDPDDSGEDLEEAGFVDEYGLTFIDPEGEALEDSRGVFLAATTVTLFKDAEAASAYLVKQNDDFERLKGEEVADGATLEESSQLEGSRIAEESYYSSARIGGQGGTLYITAFSFRLGRLAGGGGIARADDEDALAPVIEMGEALEQRIRRVLKGDVDETPVAIPTPSPTPAPLDREAGFDILPQMMPQIGDLPDGFKEAYTSVDTLEEEASLSDDSGLFARQLSSWGFLLGYDASYHRDPAQGTFSIDFEIWLHQDEDVAAEAFLDGGLLFDLPDIAEEPFPDFPAFGDESEAYKLSGPFPVSETETIQAEGYTVVIRVGQFLSVFRTASPSGQATEQEAIEIATTLEALIRSEISELDR